MTVKKRRKNTGMAAPALEVREPETREQQVVDIPMIEVPIVQFMETIME